MPCNWKAAQEAFFEQYHLRETHPQLREVIADTNTQYDIYGRHISRFVAATAVPSPDIKVPPSPKEIVDQMIIGDASVDRSAVEVKDSDSARAIVAEHLREVMGDLYEKDLSEVSDAEMLDPIQYFVFPNMFVWPGVSIPIVYRFRPIGLDPDRSLFELIYIRPLPDAGGEAPFPPDPIHLGEDDSFTTVKELDVHSAVTFDQDTDNLRAQRAGGKFMTKGMTLSNYQEIRIRHFNQTLDLYLATPTDERVPID